MERIKRFMKQHVGSDIPEDSCICRAHRREAKRHQSDPEHIPIWKKGDQGSEHVTACMYPECSATSLIEKITEPSDEIQEMFQEILNTGSHQLVKLCKTHYQQLYRQTHIHHVCAGCGAKPKCRQGAYTRHSPDAVTISNYLHDKTGFDARLAPTDTLCKSCYNMHLVLLQHIEEQASAPHLELQSDISLWKMKLQEETTDKLTRAVLATVIFVAQRFQQERALLLPHAVSVFLDNYPRAKDNEELYLELGDGTVKFSARWLMNQLITYLQPYMSYKCVVNKLGTLLYPRGGDLLKCLSLALHDSPNSVVCNENPILQLSSGEANTTSLLREAGNIVNDVIHNEIRRLKEKITDLTTFSLADSIQAINPLLWDFVCLCTRSVRERSGRANSDYTHVKNVRRFFIICLMLFATNPSCDTTLHHLVTDTVEVCGGSRQLIRVLNRLGACVSADTHDRLVTDVAEKQKDKSVWSELSPDVFTVASADNIDFLQSHAAVYCGDQSRSYHGTTVQVVQPVPTLKLPNHVLIYKKQANPASNAPCGCSAFTHPTNTLSSTLSICTTAVTHQPNTLSSTPSICTHQPRILLETQSNAIPNMRGGLKSDGLATPSETVGSFHPTQPIALVGPTIKRRNTYSPTNSPHKHGKVGPKRRRTMQLSPTKLLSTLGRTHTPASHHPNTHVQLTQFLELDNETTSKMKLSKEVFAYFLQKSILPKFDSGEVLKPLREFLLPTAAQLAEHNSSKIYYMELHGFTLFHLTLHNYNGSTSLYLTLYNSTVAVLHSTRLYITLTFLYFPLLDSTLFYLRSTSLY